MHTFVLIYCSLLVWVSGEAGCRCTHGSISSRFQSRKGVLCSLGLDMFTRITALVLHTLPKGLFAWSSSSFYRLTLVFIAVLLPLLAATANTAQRQYANPGWLEEERRHRVLRDISRGRGGQFFGEFKQEVYVKIDHWSRYDFCRALVS